MLKGRGIELEMKEEMREEWKETRVLTRRGRRGRRKDGGRKERWEIWSCGIYRDVDADGDGE